MIPLLENSRLEEIVVAEKDPIVDVITEDIFMDGHLIQKGTLFTVEEDK